MGKKKGSEYERTIAKKLSEWWCGEGKTKHLWRADMAVSGISEWPGDIARASKCRCSHTAFPFTVECKFQKESWQFKNLLYPENKNYILQWWTKIEEKTDDLNAEEDFQFIPSLVFTKNHHPDYLMVNDDGHQLIGEYDLFLNWVRNGNSFYLYRLDDVISQDSVVVKEAYEQQYTNEN